jgi:hypothetical protein
VVSTSVFGFMAYGLVTFKRMKRLGAVETGTVSWTVTNSEALPPPP